MEKTSEQTETKKQPAKKEEVVIAIKGLKKAFDGKHVLNDINLELKRGENLVILGRSGTGKSVTIECIVGLIKQDKGSLKVFGDEVIDMNDKKLKELRMKIGFLFQSGALYDSMTVRENLEFPLTRILKMKDQQEIDKRVEDALDSVGLLDSVEKMPSDLSGGMRKRAGLARTLVINPEIMLYDEPTTGLDPITSKEISELILSIQKKNKTSSIIITHDMECARITADRILVMEDGEYIAEGSFDELHKSKNKTVCAYFNDIL
ncbi:phospholipid/cholesterol/gamma-HCH transport system ATP-binding protein [Mucilaginibacter frigoritolerans]|jgi:phospholipid/cholesterol/gamma-HCH transport system ATP-binding protein|uniref:Phospholipid/cholesterol/gamma-HCH transport system ATP-binding protein n=1 Tax=Mucilaginibacter frigoritolerans TaxID=652788 RepID=A0A562UDE5_9SPHI|nr:ATP-binding cassette domain-containing protein [Mucilaginibacter frigoritolerans]TWJ03487.1 phospholipid/cholesterol/gamma-HCH transport system ATP-binding protein [Mucilaginibacter frigoritolerans]